VTQNNVGHFLFENIENGTIVNTDQSVVYHSILTLFQNFVLLRICCVGFEWAARGSV
jgi:hypothetical protein